MTPLFPACSEKYRAAHESGTRHGADIKYIVLHSTETPAGSAEAVARYFTASGSGGSAHLVVDDDKCFRCLPDLIVPWAAPPLNTSGFHIEHCGYSRWKASDWHNRELTLNRSAYKAAIRCKRFTIPPRLLTDDELAGGRRRGIVTHAQVSRVFKKSNHTDPGDGFPLKFYAGLVAGYMSDGSV